MRFRVAAFLALSVLGGSLDSPGSHEKPGALRPEDAKAAVERVIAKVEEIRGLRFKTAVPVSVVTDREARAHAVERLHSFYSDADLAAVQRTYAFLGLLPERSRILDEYLDVLAEQVGGMYDPADKEFFLLDDMPRALAPILAAHELTHALEDQYFDLDARVRATKGDDDLEFAVGAVHEGSATVVMAVYTALAMADGTIAIPDLQALAESESGKAEKLSTLAPVLRRSLLGTYLLGGTFVLRGDVSRMAAGFPTADADRIFLHGPRSSEQILHPEKFWDEARRDEPKAVTVPSPKRALGRGWKRQTGGTLGELLLGVLVNAPTPSSGFNLASSPSEWTNEAASGWGGDRWELWSKGEESLVVLETVWDTAADAEEFAKALPPTRPEWTAIRRGDHVSIVAGKPAPVARVAKSLASL